MLVPKRNEPHTDSGTPRFGNQFGESQNMYGDCFFGVFFSVTHKIGLFSPKIEAIRIALLLLPLPLPLPQLLLLLLPPPQAATPALLPLPLIRRHVVFSSCHILLYPVC